MEVPEADIHRAKLLPEDIIHVFAVFGRISEAASVAQPWGLLKGRGYRSGRWGGFGDGIVDSVPDEGVVGMVREDYVEKRLDAVEVEVVRVEREFKAQEIASKSATTCRSREQVGSGEILRRSQKDANEFPECYTSIRRVRTQQSWTAIRSCSN